MSNVPVPITTELPATARMRSGTAARLSGVPVATLRVWERRYGVVAAPKTATGQRSYSAHDVQRLRLLRQLTDCGHGIGRIATLDLATLMGLAADVAMAVSLSAAAGPLASGTQATLGVPLPLPLRVQVVGRSAATRLAGAAGCVVVAVHDDVEQALLATPSGAADAASVGAPTRDAAISSDVLLVQLASLQPAVAAGVRRLAARLKVRACLVLYAFGAEAEAEQLRQAGVRVRREPVSGRELARWVGGAASLHIHAVPDGSLDTTPAAPSTARRFSDAELVSFAEQSSSVACECPRHLAEICMQLVGFEHYSADCGARSPADAALHARLSALAGSARASFERALEQVAVEEGLLVRAAAD